VVGLGEAIKLALTEHSERCERAMQLKQQLLADLRPVEFQINGDLQRSQPHVLNVSFTGVDADALLLALRESLAIAKGSACTSQQRILSHVLRAMGLDTRRIESAVRLSWGAFVTHIPTERLIRVVDDLRQTW
jgi:cysteine desulfurase